MDNFLLNVNGDGEFIIKGEQLRYKDYKTNIVYIFVEAKITKYFEDFIKGQELSIKIDGVWESVKHRRISETDRTKGSQFWLDRTIQT